MTDHEQAYRDYYSAVADNNRAQFRLYRALGHPAQSLMNAQPPDPPASEALPEKKEPEAAQGWGPLVPGYRPTAGEETTAVPRPTGYLETPPPVSVYPTKDRNVAPASHQEN
ncbi:MAG TPA: hypothetical protein VLM40_05515 [Gemmata sp.]|nr:hypothetical protein [Gemmata sp.]